MSFPFLPPSTPIYLVPFRNRRMNLLVGAGGWGYLGAQGGGSLDAYASAFKFVEVNSTFYDYPDNRTVYSWRKRVPQEFEFSIRCHRDIARGLQSGGDTISSTLEKMEPICNILGANALVVLVPATVTVEEATFRTRLEEIVSTFHSSKTRVGVEFRNGKPSPETIRVLEDNDAVHIVDLSREEPLSESGVLYSRLFGKGKKNIYEFDDAELKTITEKASVPRYEKSILAFHGVRMYRDAARTTAYLNAGEFPKITDYTGLASLGQVLKEDAVFPSSRSQLIEHQGWKLFDLTPKKRERAGDYLGLLPEGSYNSAEEVMASLQNQFPQEGSGEMTIHATTQRSS